MIFNRDLFFKPKIICKIHNFDLKENYEYNFLTTWLTCH